MASRHPAARVLAVLELLQARDAVTGQELARRLGVDRRTVRRYIAALEAMGVPIVAERGAAGGYSLVAGFRLPPLMLTNDEALAVALGLGMVRSHALVEASHVATAAQTKLERVLPTAVRSRMQSLVATVRFSDRAPAFPPRPGALGVVATAAHERRGVLLAYRAAGGRDTERDFDPYGVAFSGGAWYVAGYCHLRRDLRTFRLDRVVTVEPQARPFERPASFDVLAHLVRSIATLPRRFAIEVVLATDLASASRVLVPELGILEARDRGVVLHGQVDDLRWFARELAHLPWPFTVIKPRALATAVREHARALLRSV